MALLPYSTENMVLKGLFITLKSLEKLAKISESVKIFSKRLFHTSI